MQPKSSNHVIKKMIDSKEVFNTSEDIENQGQCKFKWMNPSLVPTAL